MQVKGVCSKWKGLPKSIKAIKKNYTVFHEVCQQIFLSTILFCSFQTQSYRWTLTTWRRKKNSKRKKLPGIFLSFLFNLHPCNILPIEVSVIRYSYFKQQLLFFLILPYIHSHVYRLIDERNRTKDDSKFLSFFFVLFRCKEPWIFPSSFVFIILLHLETFSLYFVFIW